MLINQGWALYLDLDTRGYNSRGAGGWRVGVQKRNIFFWSEISCDNAIEIE